MKKLSFFAIHFFLVSSLFGQQTTPQPPLTKQDYLLKSKHQKTTGLVLLGIGVGVMTAGLIASDNGDETSFDDISSGAIIFGVGLVPALCSIPFFIASSRNKRKAMNVTGMLQMRNSTIWAVSKNYLLPSLAVRVSF